MATKAHCAYCFDSLAASFERREPLSLAQVEQLWEQYHTSVSGGVVADSETGEEEDDADMADGEITHPPAKPAAISRLLNRDDSASSSSSSLPSTSTGNTTPASGVSSRTSLSSSPAARRQGEAHPLFVTWNTVSRSGHKSLRGCIGTFEALELEHGLKSYALTSAFEDVRFPPIPSSLLPSLSCHVTLLTNFSTPSKEPLAWTLGKHGMRISFTHHGRRYGATYLPDVASEQGWTKEEAVVSLMKKAGWNGSSREWQKVWRDGKGELVTYEGKQVALGYAEWKEWRAWVDGLGVNKEVSR